jgi:hypothetical protein
MFMLPSVKIVYAKAALLSQRLALERASWFFARRAGFFDRPPYRKS